MVTLVTTYSLIKTATSHEICMISLKESPLYTSRHNNSYCGNTLPHRRNHMHNSTCIGMLPRLKHHEHLYTYTLHCSIHVCPVYIIPWEHSVMVYLVMQNMMKLITLCTLLAYKGIICKLSIALMKSSLNTPTL